MKECNKPTMNLVSFMLYASPNRQKLNTAIRAKSYQCLSEFLGVQKVSEKKSIENRRNELSHIPSAKCTILHILLQAVICIGRHNWKLCFCGWPRFKP